MGKKWKQLQILISWAPKSLQMVTAAMKLKMLAPWKKSYDKPRQHIQKQRCYFSNKYLSSQSYGFSSSHVCMLELDHKESWVQRIEEFELWCWRRLLRVPLDCKEIQPVHPKGDQSWIIIGRIDAEVEAPILWPPDVKNWLIGKHPDAGKDRRQEEKRATEDEMVGWHHQLDGCEFQQAPGVGDGQGSWHAAAHGVAKNQTQLT